MGARAIIISAFKKSVGNSSVSLPRDIEFEIVDNSVKMTLNMRAIGISQKPYNMQHNTASFEGWASVIYTHYLKQKNFEEEGGKIILDTEVKLDNIEKFDNKLGHYQRFLYRAMRFSDEYDWLVLSDNLAGAVDSFRDIFTERMLVNNVPLTSSKTNSIIAPPYSESDVEMLYSISSDPKALQAKEKLLKTAKMATDEIYHQLPVGLFVEEIADYSAIFTGKKSAIDLWTADNSSIAIFELKKDNVMIGIITELFFYSVFVYDVFVCGNNICFDRYETIERGYQELSTKNNEDKDIKAFFLTDRIHPLITQDVIDVLNNNSNSRIKYSNICYDTNDFN